jgi:hypothetical protein
MRATRESCNDHCVPHRAASKWPDAATPALRRQRGTILGRPSRAVAPSGSTPLRTPRAAHEPAPSSPAAIPGVALRTIDVQGGPRSIDLRAPGRATARIRFDALDHATAACGIFDAAALLQRFGSLCHAGDIPAGTAGQGAKVQEASVLVCPDVADSHNSITEGGLKVLSNSGHYACN